MPTHRLTNFEIQKYYQNEPRFNRVYSRNNLPKIKDDAYVINLHEYKSIVIGLHVIVGNVIYFDSFGLEYTPKRNLKVYGQQTFLEC